KAKVRARTEKFFKIARPLAIGERLGATQETIYQQLKGQDSVALATLRESIKNPHSSLKAMEERGLITSWEEEFYRDPFADAPPTNSTLFEPTPTQQVVLDQLASARDAN